MSDKRVRDVKLSWLDLDNMKEMCKKILETNIAIRTFQKRFMPDLKAENIEQTSIGNSKRALELIDKAENVESINYILVKMVGYKRWLNFIEVCSCFSGILSSEEFYKMDKDFTDKKKSKVGEA